MPLSGCSPCAPRCFSLIFRERLCELNIHRGNTVVQVTLAYEARK
ncbi:Hok/Gef family protein [Escherichia coli]